MKKKIIWLTDKYLIDQGKDSKEREEILNMFREEMANITIKIQYVDVFGNKQKILNREIL